MWYKNIAVTFFGLVTKHTCDRRTDRRTYGRTDRIMTPKTALSIARAVIIHKRAQWSAEAESEAQGGRRQADWKACWKK